MPLPLLHLLLRLLLLVVASSRGIQQKEWAVLQSMPRVQPWINQRTQIRVTRVFYTDFFVATNNMCLTDVLELKFE